MTQEELDSLMQQDIQDLSIDLNNQSTKDVEKSDTDTKAKAENIEDMDLAEAAIHYKPDANKKWPPPPPTEEHKVVHQLDDVTKDSEVKMTEIFDQLEVVSSSAGLIESKVKSLKVYFRQQTEMLSTLNEKFPKIDAFVSALENTKKAEKDIKAINNAAMDCGDAAMQAMDIMQYQDIHRQKIERVINVMRALSQYMNSLFEGKVDDARRVSSATYIAGDTSNESASEEDIEALIASFGAK